MIQDPITLPVDALVGDAHHIMAEHRIGGIPVVDDGGFLKGIVTNRDLRFEDDMKRPIAEVMTAEGLVTTPNGTDLKRAEEILRDKKIEKLPVVDAKGKLVGLITYRDIIKLEEYPNACKDQYGRLRCAAAVGVTGTPWSASRRWSMPGWTHSSSTRRTATAAASSRCWVTSRRRIRTPTSSVATSPRERPPRPSSRRVLTASRWASGPAPSAPPGSSPGWAFRSSARSCLSLRRWPAPMCR